MPARESHPHPLLEIRKYPNRRYYDATRSEHLSLAQIHQLIHEGHDVRVVEAKSGEDITAKVLTQILLEYEPVKLGLFSSELLIRAIRVKDRMLADFVDLHFKQAFEAFCRSRTQFERALEETRQWTSSFAHPLAWAGQLLPTRQAQAHRPDQAQTPPRSGSSEEFRGEIAALRKELSALRAVVKKSSSTSRTARRSAGK